jgi:hypothetical protein
MPFGLSDSSRLRPLLFGSIAVNLLLIGWVVGWTAGGPRPPAPHGFGLAERLEGRLSAEGARRIATRVQTLQTEIAGGMRAFDEGRAGLRRAVEKDPLDEPAVRSEFDAMISSRTSQEDRVRELVVGMLRDLAAADRRALVETLFLPPPPPESRPPRP